MHDIKLIRKNPDIFDQEMVRRGLAPISSEILSHDKENRGDKTSLQKLQEESNSLAKKIGELKAKKQNAGVEIARSKELKAKIAEFKEESEKEADNITSQLLDNILYLFLIFFLLMYLKVKMRVIILK